MLFERFDGAAVLYRNPDFMEVADGVFKGMAILHAARNFIVDPIGMSKRLFGFIEGIIEVDEYPCVFIDMREDVGDMRR